MPFFNPDTNLDILPFDYGVFGNDEGEAETSAKKVWSENRRSELLKRQGKHSSLQVTAACHAGYFPKMFAALSARRIGFQKQEK